MGGKHLTKKTLDFADQLSGEKIPLNGRMTELSGGQTRALLIADAVVIGNSPIILLDEVENAGIYKERALKLLKGYHKIMVFATHDPVITLFSDFRIVMRNGGMQNVIETTEKERRAAEEVKKLNNLFMDLREKIRVGDTIELKDVVL